MAAELFWEKAFIWNEYKMMIYSGVNLSSPTFQFTLKEKRLNVRCVSKCEIESFILHLFDSLPLKQECILIMLCYLWRLVEKEKLIEIRQENWRPMVFISILVASKFYEDLSLYNVDFVETAQIYSL